MKNQEISRQLQKLKTLIDQTRTACGDNLELRAHWAKYICIVSAGLIENSVSEIFGDFIDHKSSKPVAAYARAVLSQVQNPRTQKIIDIARSFKPEWGDELENFVNDEGRKEAINSIMSNRHLIAHGQNSSVTISQVKTWIDKSVEIIEYVEDLCLR